MEGSLRLKTDYVDLYQIQWPNPEIPIDETISALEKLVSDGKIKYFGVGNFSSDQINMALSHTKTNNLIAAQTEYDLFNREIEKGYINFAQSKNLSIIAYLSHGKDLFNDDEKKLLEKLSNKYEVSIRSIILNWIISKKYLGAY